MQDCSLGLLNSRAAKDKCRNIRSAIRIILPVYRILNFHNQKDEMSTKCVKYIGLRPPGDLESRTTRLILLVHYDTSSGYETELQYQ